MTHLDYEATLQDAKAQLLAIQNSIGENQKARDTLEKELVTVRQIIVALSTMLGREFNEDDELGLTDAVRQAFRTSGKPLAPTDVKGRMESLGYNTAKYGNTMAAIHTVINRLIAQKQIKTSPPVAGKPMYEWIMKSVAEPLEPLPSLDSVVVPRPGTTIEKK
jgi:hypothetical protein